MCWRKHGLLQASVILASMALFLVLAARTPVSLAHAQQITSEAATPSAVTVQPTPTEDATVTALNKEKLAQEVQQLKNQNEPDFFGWLQANATLLSTLLVVVGGLIGLWRWFADKRGEREKRAEERFQSAVTGLGDEKEGAKIGAAILLRTFLRPGYEQFYIQTFDLAVANLRLPRTSHTSEDPDGPSCLPKDHNTPLPLTTLSRALIVVFKYAFPLARKQHRILLMPDPEIPLSFTTRIKNLMIVSFMKAFPFVGRKRQSRMFRELLDATGIVLDNAYLEWADLREAWMPQASLRKANLSMANLYFANLHGADLSGADLTLADLRLAELDEANLSGANLRATKFNEAGFSEANLRGADLSRADLTDADLYKADLSGANLTETKFEVASLNGTILRGVKGLTKEELEACRAARAIIDEDLTTSPPQSTVAPLPAPQSNDERAPSAQGSTPPSDSSGSGAISSQQTPES